MAIIYSYPQIGELATNDTIAISDFSNGNKTKSVTIGQLSSYFNTGVVNNLVQQKSVTLTSAQLLSLNGGGSIELIAAPGVNKVIVIISTATFLDYNSIAYNFFPSLNLTLGSKTQSSISNSFLNVTSDSYTTFDNQGGGSGSFLQPNTALSLFAEPIVTVTTGNSPFTISILYRIVDFS